MRAANQIWFRYWKCNACPRLLRLTLVGHLIHRMMLLPCWPWEKAEPGG